MMNKIDNTKNGEERFYGVGHFDLIIIDEAHRSIYNRYKAIFDYFDACIVGLTATPKDGIDHNTFELFSCSTEDPTFLYELNQAVPTYLSPYKNIDIKSKFLREGIKYKDLSPTDKAKYEDTFIAIVISHFYSPRPPSSSLRLHLLQLFTDLSWSTAKFRFLRGVPFFLVCYQHCLSLRNRSSLLHY